MPATFGTSFAKKSTWLSLVLVILSALGAPSSSFAKDLFIGQSEGTPREKEQVDGILAEFASVPACFGVKWKAATVDILAVQDEEVDTITLQLGDRFEVDDQYVIDAGRSWYFALKAPGEYALILKDEQGIHGLIRAGDRSVEILPLDLADKVAYLFCNTPQTCSELADTTEEENEHWQNEEECSEGACATPVEISVEVHLSANAGLHIQGGSPLKIDLKQWANAAIADVNVPLANACLKLVVRHVELNSNGVTFPSPAGLQSAMTIVAAQPRRADIAIFIVDKSSTSFVGIAPILPLSAKAQMIVSVDQGAFGIQHELGHLLGGRHFADAKKKPFSFGHGYIKNSISTIVGTTLPYAKNGVYSDGSKKTSSNNACALRRGGKVVAGFFQEPP